MTRFPVRRNVLVIGIAFALLADCGGSQPPTGA